jgi:hypothetical protein
MLAAITVFVIERRLVTAALWSLASSLLCLLGLMHSCRFAPGDTVSSIPLIERLTNPDWPGGSLFPAAAYAAGYAGMAVVLLLAKWFTEPGEPGTKP